MLYVSETLYFFKFLCLFLYSNKTLVGANELNIYLCFATKIINLIDRLNNYLSKEYLFFLLGNFYFIILIFAVLFKINQTNYGDEIHGA